MRDVVAAELLLREPVGPERLNGCGLLVVNPPWRFMEEAEPLLAGLAAVLGEADGGFRVVRIVEE
jgi:23S rRNA (adenine2030-N6)-methyltransferase